MPCHLLLKVLFRYKWMKKTEGIWRTRLPWKTAVEMELKNLRKSIIMALEKPGKLRKSFLPTL